MPSHRFYSKKQWRWAFATHQTWARRHAHQTPGGKKVRYDILPGSKRSRAKKVAHVRTHHTNMPRRKGR